MKEKKRYAMIQLDSELHKELKTYTKMYGFQIKGFVQALIRQALKDKKLR